MTFLEHGMPQRKGNYRKVQEPLHGILPLDLLHDAFKFLFPKGPGSTLSMARMTVLARVASRALRIAWQTNS